MLKFLRFVSWLLYITSFIITIVNIITLQYQHITAVLLLVSLILFLVGGIILFTKGRNYQIEKEGILTCGVTNKLIGKLFTIIGGLCMIIVIIAMLSIFIYGGQPTIIDGIYCTRQHGKIIKVLTMEEYNFLYFFEKELFACGSLLLNALFLGNSNFRKKQR